MRDPTDYRGQLETLLIAVREELEASGAFQDTFWRLLDDTLQRSREDHVDLLNSYATGADVRAELTQAIEAIVPPGATLELRNYIYLCVARKRS